MKEITNDEMNLTSANVRTDASVLATISHLVELGKVTKEQGDEIFWLHAYGLEHGLSNGELADRVSISKTTISQLFSGKYPADNWSNMVANITTFRKQASNALFASNVGFVETKTSKLIFQVCDNALNDRMPAFIYGASHIGKTFNLEEYVRRTNSPSVKMMRCSTSTTLREFAKDLAAECHLRKLEHRSASDIFRGICASLNSSSLLILDEFHAFLETVDSERSRQLVEKVREIYDRTHCGLVLCMTKVGLIDLEEGPNHMLFDQLRRRGIIKLVLPDVPSVKDINDFSRAYGLPIPTGEALSFCKNLLKLRGLGVFVAQLQKTCSICEKSNGKTALSWDFFQKVSNGFLALEHIENDY